MSCVTTKRMNYTSMSYTRNYYRFAGRIDWVDGIDEIPAPRPSMGSVVHEHNY